MNSTLYNGYSGIKTHQFGLDSVSNNIANINTTGYRANMPEFKSLFSQGLEGANPNSSVSSDMNYGSTSASNAISNNDGSYKESEGEFDIAYAGKGWFVVGDRENNAIDITTPSSNVFYTRDGAFSRDGEGYIVNSSGYYMMGVDLRKINNNIFTSNTENDEENLAAANIKPLQIPKDLQYGPTQSTKVELALNLNKNEALGNVGALQNVENLLNKDLNSFLVENEPLNAIAYNDVNIKINDGINEEEYTFTYGDKEGDEENTRFKTLGELKQLIKDKTNLDLELTNAKNLELNLKSPSTKDLKITLGGKLFEKLGLKGEKDLKLLDGKPYDKNAKYEINDIAKMDGAIFKKMEEGEFPSAWTLIDSSNVKEYQEGEYKLDSIVKYENNIYQKIGDGNGNPKEDTENWKLIGENVEIEIEQYKEDLNYAKNMLVYFDGEIYRKIGDGNGNPKEDTENWKLVNNDKFNSKPLNIANYKTTTEFYDENGEKLLIISKFTLEENNENGQSWNVESNVFDSKGEIAIGETLIHKIEFDKDGKVVNTNEVTLKYGDKEIKYDISKSKDKESSGLSYIDSGVTSASKDGAPKGELMDVAIDNNGVISLAFSNGVVEPMGRVAIAAFVNDQGLSKIGNNLLQISSYVNGNQGVVSSGAPLSGWDENGNLRFGQVLHKYLETSNVDPASAMTDLIVYQRGYSMNAKAFTTGDDLIKEAINLKR